MTEGIPDDVVRALNAIGFVLFAEDIAGEFSFQRYSPIREAEMVMTRRDAGTWQMKLTAKYKGHAWEAVPLAFYEPADGEWAPIPSSCLTREFLERFLVRVIDGPPPGSTSD